MNNLKTFKMILKITSNKIIKEAYLQLNITAGEGECGTIDFISNKINFNIVGQYSYKGIEMIKNIELEYTEGRLIFIFKNKKNFTFYCSVHEFEKVNKHIKTYGDADKSSDIKNSFFNDYEVV